MRKRVNKRSWIWCMGCGGCLPIGFEYCDYSAGIFCTRECHRKWKLEQNDKDKMPRKL